MNNRLALKKPANLKVGVVRTITLYVRIGESKLKVVFRVVRNVSVPVLFEISFIDRFVKGSFPPEPKLVPYNSNPVPILVIMSKSEDPRNRNKAQDAMVIKKDASRLLRMTRKTKIPPMCSGIVFVATDMRELVQMDPLLEGDNTQARTPASGIIYAFKNRPFNVIVRNPTNVQRSLAKH